MDSIGDILRSAREERKIPVAQVSRDTRISEKYILAMEDNEFSAMPALAYAKGFLRLYAEYLGLDPKALIEQLMVHYGGIARQPIPIDKETLFRHTAPSGVLRYTALGVGGAVVLVVLLFSSVKLFRSCGRTVPERRSAGTEDLETLPLPSLPTVRPALAAVPQATPIEAPKAKQKKLSIKARENVMVKVYADGVLLFQETIRKGKEESWTAKEGFDVKIARGRAAEITEYFYRPGRKGDLLQGQAAL
ncbi:MAG: helix-turn-helix domain-containing protein [Candidatus Aureabacteria bacterium]|nr:helix-turn-helix domain-containing protein [Candidatus Auribacterota bacterium]